MVAVMRHSLLFAIFVLSSFTLFAHAESRRWTSSDGKSIDGEILALEGDTVTLKTDRGTFELPLSRFAEADQLFAKEWLKSSGEKMKPAKDGDRAGKVAPVLGDFEELELGVWPQYVVAELEVDQIEEVEPGAEPEEGESEDDEDDDEEEGSSSSSDDSEENFIYRTPHFEFHSPDKLSTSVVREFARIFEASYNFVDQMPLGLAPSPSANGYYQTRLYMTKDDYYEDGGMEGSGGMFSWRRRGNEMSGMIKVPLPNLGVEYTGTRFVVDSKKRSTTLTHEIVHQVMMRWLATPMPTWLSEGIAEFVSSQTYDNGRFKLSSMNRAISEEVTRGRGREFRMLNLEKLMNISSSEWASELSAGTGGMNYNSANILAYYFLRLDGEGDAAHLVEFLKALTSSDREAAKAAQEEHLLRGRSYEALQEELAKAWRGEGLQIEFQ